MHATNRDLMVFISTNLMDDVSLVDYNLHMFRLSCPVFRLPRQSNCIASHLNMNMIVHRQFIIIYESVITVNCTCAVCSTFAVKEIPTKTDVVS